MKLDPWRTATELTSTAVAVPAARVQNRGTVSGRQQGDSGHPTHECPGCPQCASAVATMHSGPELRRVRPVDVVAVVIDVLDARLIEAYSLGDCGQPRNRLGESEPGPKLQLQV